MVDYRAIEEADAALRKSERVLQHHMGDAHGLDVLENSGNPGASKSGKIKSRFLKALPSAEFIREATFLLESALAEKANAKIILACLQQQLYPRSRYNFDISKRVFLSDILDLLEEENAVCCLAVYRAIRSISLRASFVPPAGQIVDAIQGEEAGLISMQSGLARIAQYLSEGAPRS
ncbi:hypothetical protein [Hoeflea sp. TYP-13]|uniref:hypothetical protein n=1 Tax=Hoeflea sp. TYP-13 TaxID=3230023 RepID=UPI0034C6D49F